MTMSALSLNPELTGAVTGAGLGGLLQWLRGRADDIPHGERPSVLKGMLLGGLMGGAGGHAYRRFSAPGMTWQSWLDDQNRKDEAARRFIAAGKVTPRQINEVQFGRADLDKKLQAAARYREVNPELKYMQSLDTFDTPVPLVPRKPGALVHDMVFKNTNTLAGFQPAARLSPLEQLSARLHGINTEAHTVVDLDRVAQEAEKRPKMTADGETLSVSGAPDRTYSTLFDTLAHEIKGHATQSLALSEGRRTSLPAEGGLPYLRDGAEFERRIQAVKDWGQSTGRRWQTPQDFKDLLKVIEQEAGKMEPNAPMDSELHDLNTLFKSMKPEEAAKALEHAAKLAPGIVALKRPLSPVS